MAKTWNHFISLVTMTFRRSYMAIWVYQVCTCVCKHARLWVSGSIAPSRIFFSKIGSSESLRQEPSTWPTEYCLMCLAVSDLCMNIFLATILPMSLTEGSWQVESWWWKSMQSILLRRKRLHRDTVKQWGLQCWFNGMLTYKVNHTVFKFTAKFPYDSQNAATDKIWRCHGNHAQQVLLQ